MFTATDQGVRIRDLCEFSDKIFQFTWKITTQNEAKFAEITDGSHIIIESHGTPGCWNIDNISAYYYHGEAPSSLFDILDDLFR